MHSFAASVGCPVSVGLGASSFRCHAGKCVRPRSRNRRNSCESRYHAVTVGERAPTSRHIPTDISKVLMKQRVFWKKASKKARGGHCLGHEASTRRSASRQLAVLIRRSGVTPKLIRFVGIGSAKPRQGARRLASPRRPENRMIIWTVNGLHGELRPMADTVLPVKLTASAIAPQATLLRAARPPRGPLSAAEYWSR